MVGGRVRQQTGDMLHRTAGWGCINDGDLTQWTPANWCTPGRPPAVPLAGLVPYPRWTSCCTPGRRLLYPGPPGVPCRSYCTLVDWCTPGGSVYHYHYKVLIVVPLALEAAEAQ